jgi:hypothetical protein
MNNLALTFLLPFIIDKLFISFQQNMSQTRPMAGTALMQPGVVGSQSATAMPNQPLMTTQQTQPLVNNTVQLDPFGAL